MTVMTLPIESILDRLLTLHQQLNKLAVQKTDSLKKGNMKRLEMLMAEEGTLVKNLRQLEQERITVFGNKTISLLLEELQEDERERISQLQEKVKAEYLLLKERNELNQQLIEQSLQFVHLSIDLLLPEPEPVTYGKPQKKGYEAAVGQSFFDSKA